MICGPLAYMQMNIPSTKSNTTRRNNDTYLGICSVCLLKLYGLPVKVAYWLVFFHR